MDIISEMLTHKNADFTKKRYSQFLPETLSIASNVAADILLTILSRGLFQDAFESAMGYSSFQVGFPL